MADRKIPPAGNLASRLGRGVYRFLQKSVYHSLSGKLIASIGVSTVLASAVFWFFLTDYHERELLRNTVNNGLFLGEHVRKATRYGMLIFHRELIQKTLEEVSSAEGILLVKIFDKKGMVKYSSMIDEVGVSVDKASPDCKRCHLNPDKPVETLLVKDRWIISTDPATGGRALMIIEPIYNDPDCFTAECHVHTEREKVLGIVKCSISLESLDNIVRQDKKAITFYIVSFTILISGAISVILWKFVSRPVSLLVDGMERAGGGDLGHTLDIGSKDEMGDLATAFNSMVTDLRNAKEHISNVETEKLAVLGRMAAGVAHEINNPLTGIVIFSHLLLKHMPPESEERKDIEVIIEQADRCKNIIKGLLDFARSTPVEKSTVDVGEVLKSTLNMIVTNADFQNVKFVVNAASSPGTVVADPQRLQQVFLNILVNAVDAMEGRGTITITLRTVPEGGAEYAEIRFSDTGQGISEANLSKIFEPFFTTKPVGKGTGLGLAVSHGIIEEHGGKLLVESFPGEGACFIIRLPLGGGGAGG